MPGWRRSVVLTSTIFTSPPTPQGKQVGAARAPANLTSAVCAVQCVASMTMSDPTLVSDIARGIVEDVAPDELPLFGMASRAYLNDPKLVTAGGGAADDMLGFGGGEVELLTPVIFSITSGVVSFLVATVISAAKSETESVVKQQVRQLFKRFNTATVAATPAEVSADHPDPRTACRGATGRLRHCVEQRRAREPGRAAGRFDRRPARHRRLSHRSPDFPDGHASLRSGRTDQIPSHCRPATDAHFTLLIISVIGASFLLYEMLFNNVPALWDAKIASQQRCAAGGGDAVSRRRPRAQPATDRGAHDLRAAGAPGAGGRRSGWLRAAARRGRGPVLVAAGSHVAQARPHAIRS